MKFRSLLILLFILSVYPNEKLKAGELPQEKRIVFLGDSITQAGRYIEIVDAALIAQYPDHDKTFIPLGLSSETVSGLSEPGHAGGKFPRPDLHERLSRVLDKAKPDLVIACYGMNCGIYHPLNDTRFQAYKNGILKLREKVLANNSQIIHLTPPVFDSLPIKSNTLPAGLETYTKPFEGYNIVLDNYSNWLMQMREKEQWTVYDLHSVMNAALLERRLQDPEFTFAKDGVHPSPAGQLLIASVLLDAWGLNTQADGTPDHPQGAAILELVQKKHAILRLAWLSHVGHLRPGVAVGLPLEEGLKKAAELDAQARLLGKLSGKSQ
jgi:lysophospholipase L1-like esterase